MTWQSTKKDICGTDNKHCIFFFLDLKRKNEFVNNLFVHVDEIQSKNDSCFKLKEEKGYGIEDWMIAEH